VISKKGEKMKKKIVWLGLSLLMVVAILLTSCGTSTTTPTPTTKTATTAVSTTPVGLVALTVTNGSKVKTYSLADLQALKSITGNGGTKGKGGTVNGPFSYQGVALIDLLNAVGGIASGQSVKLTGSDGYTTTITYDQIINGGFSTYDATGAPVTPATKPTLVVVYSSNGTLLDSTTGPLEMGLLSNENLVSDGNLWAKMLIKIDIVSATTSSSTTTTATATTTSSTTVATTATTTTSVVVTTTTPVATTPVILSVINGAQTTTYSLAQLQQLQPIFVQAANIKGTAISSVDSYVGIQLKTILDVVGGFTSSNSVKVADSTGYSKIFTYAMIENGTGFTVLDNTGATLTSPQPVVPFLAYSKNGTMLDTTYGPLYLCFSSRLELNQYTQSSLWVKNVATITILATP